MKSFTFFEKEENTILKRKSFQPNEIYKKKMKTVHQNKTKEWYKVKKNPENYALSLTFIVSFKKKEEENVIYSTKSASFFFRR